MFLYLPDKATWREGEESVGMLMAASCGTAICRMKSVVVQVRVGRSFEVRLQQALNPMKNLIFGTLAYSFKQKQKQLDTNPRLRK